MLTFSGLASNGFVASDGGNGIPFAFQSYSPSAAGAAKQGYSTGTSTTGACRSPDVMSEFGCLTPKIAGPGSSSWNTVYVCPPGSKEYSSTHCLRTGDPTADARAAEFAYQSTQAAAAAKAAADAQKAADAAARAQADADAVAAAKGRADGEAQRQQAYADQVAAAAAEAAQRAIDAYIAAHGANGHESPGMTVTPADLYAQTQMAVVPRKIPWLWIGLGVLAVGGAVAMLRR